MSRLLPQKMSQWTFARPGHIWIGIRARFRGSVIWVCKPNCQFPLKIWHTRPFCLKPIIVNAGRGTAGDTEVILHFQVHFGQSSEVNTRNRNAPWISTKSSKITKSFVAFRWIQYVREGQQILPSRRVFLRTNEHLTKTQTPRRGIAEERSGWNGRLLSLRGIRFSRNVGAYLLDYTALHPYLLHCLVHLLFYFIFWTIWRRLDKYLLNDG